MNVLKQIEVECLKIYTIISIKNMEAVKRETFRQGYKTKIWCLQS